MSRKQRRLAQKKQKQRVSNRKPLVRKDAEQKVTMAIQLFENGQYSDAAELTDLLIKSTPPSAKLFKLRGLIEFNQQEFRAAADNFRLGLSMDPNASELGNLLGAALSESGDVKEAVVSYRRALLNDPRNSVILTNLGSALNRCEEWEKAEKAFRDSLIYRSHDLETTFKLADVLEHQGKIEDAIAVCRRLIDFEPTLVEAYQFLGELLMNSRNWDQALALADEAISKAIVDAEIFTLKGYALGALLNFKEAEAALEKAMELDPARPQAKKGLSILYFYQEKWSEAWKAYEARWHMPPGTERPFRQPLWQGQSLAGKKLLLWGEQGVGDEVMFATMIPDLLASGPDVSFEMDARLVPLFSRSFGDVVCVPRSDEPNELLTETEFDFQLPSGGLGQFLRKQTSDFGKGNGFLRADTEKTNRLRQKYQSGDDLLVGIAWYSSDGLGLSKSVPLNALAPLFAVPNVRFIDLQYGDTSAERNGFQDETGSHLIHDGDIDQMQSLDDFAAQIAAMDLVISISNSTVHLAGALGVPTWIMLQAAPMQRWLMNRSDSPWYSSVELFRQRQLDDWDGVIQRVCKRLQSFEK